MNEANPSRLKADLALMAVAFIWGATFVLVKSALDSASTILFLTVRFAIAALVLHFIFRRRREKTRNWRRELFGGASVGFWLFAGYCLQTTGLKFTTPAKAGFITGFYIVLVPLLGAVVYRKVPQLSELVGVAMAAIGTGLLTLQSFRFDLGIGDLFVLAGAVAFAFQVVVLGHFSTEMSFESLSVNQIGTGAVLGALTFWWIEPPKWQWSPTLIVALVVTSLLATSLAFSVQSWAQQFTTPTRTALIFALEPVFAWLTSFVLTGEVLTLRAGCGAVLILAGILLVELKPIGLRRHPSSRRGVSLQE